MQMTNKLRIYRNKWEKWKEMQKVVGDLSSKDGIKDEVLKEEKRVGKMSRKDLLCKKFHKQ